MGRRCLLLTPDGAGCSMLLLPPFSPSPNIFLHISHKPRRSVLPPQPMAEVSTAGVPEPERSLLKTQGRGGRGLAGSGAATAFISVQVLCSGSLT